MTDIYCGMSLMLLLSAACFAATRRAVRGLPMLLCDLLAVLIVAAICAHIRWLWDDIRMARWLPFSNLIVISNWYLPLAAILGGLAWQRIEQHSVRRWIVVVLLLSSSLYATMRPVWGVPPQCHQQWEQTPRGRLFYQTTTSTCSAAAAATLLSIHDIPADEQEMAELCLTRDGTTWKGLFRGLTLKTSASPWSVEVFHCAPGELLRDDDLPIVLCTKLAVDHPHARFYEQEWGWIPGTSHTVVVLRRARQGEFVVHDPVAGIEIWSAEDLQAVWTGEGMRLVTRAPRRAADPTIAVSLIHPVAN
jgi:hypothetical protein